MAEAARSEDRRAPEAPALRAPDFYIAGHEKCGTTAMHMMLAQHPQIFMPELKEPRFYAPELRSRFKRFGNGELPETYEEYLMLFAPAQPGQRTGEASPTYLRSHGAARRIAEHRPDARIIAILREPAAYLRSFHMQAVHNHTETETDFGRAIALEPARREGRRIPRLSQSPPALLYSEHVRYTEQLRRFEAVFEPEQMLVLIYEDFRGDNAAVLREVLRFLDVDEDVELLQTETYRLEGVRSVTLLRTGLALSMARKKAAAGPAPVRALNSVIPTPTDSEAVRSRWRRAVYTENPPADEAVMMSLRRRFLPEVEAVSAHLGRDLVTLWGYDKLG